MQPPKSVYACFLRAFIAGAPHRSPKILASGTNTDMPPEMPLPLSQGAFLPFCCGAK
jgi:hypothetical protein